MPAYYNAAKINLFLQVEGKRKDGYHTLTSVMQSVSLFDGVTVDFERTVFSLDCGGADLGPREKNSVYRMWYLLKEHYHLPGEIAVTLDKKIPVGAGLAGGSGNAAAVLRAVTDHYQLDLCAEEIVAVCREVGADVAFCYFGGTMLATGIGERLKPLPPLPHWDILLFHGGFHVSTPEIFKAYDEIALGVTQVPVEPMLHALEKASREGVLYALYNGLEKATFPRYAALRKLSDQLEAYALPHLMSGSGPTVFALAEKKAAQNLMKASPPELGRIDHVYPVTKGIFSEEEMQK
ncbi:MAG TPA: 4-(cytidine 5'-diphospho)-2-C-methyl-D-erythritol kinase [Clostridiales bacterium]|nr:4-(cytidine 5'-diphospho)-2-C-methyl-D-erythritol kinase [Clostridiales bacterium]